MFMNVILTFMNISRALRELFQSLFASVSGLGGVEKFMNFMSVDADGAEGAAECASAEC